MVGGLCVDVYVSLFLGFMCRYMSMFVGGLVLSFYVLGVGVCITYFYVAVGWCVSLWVVLLYVFKPTNNTTFKQNTNPKRNTSPNKPKKFFGFLRVGGVCITCFLCRFVVLSRVMLFVCYYVFAYKRHK